MNRDGFVTVVLFGLIGASPALIMLSILVIVEQFAGAPVPPPCVCVCPGEVSR